MKKKLSLIAVLAALAVTFSIVFSACGNQAADTAAPEETTVAQDAGVAQDENVTEENATQADETTATQDEAAKADETTASADEAKEVSFKLEIESGEAGSDEALDCKAAGTLGDYMRSLDGCEWEESQYGIFITGFNGIFNDDTTGTYWMLYVDGEAAITGADEITLEEGATYTWKYEAFE